jgi:hypothetical protein
MSGTGEEWRRVEGWPYEVSSEGRIRRAASASGTRVGLILKQGRSRDGYSRAQLRRHGRTWMVYVHCLVAEAFLGPRPEGFQVNHKNGDKADPRAENLEWVTSTENQIHAYDTGLQLRGEGHGRAKLTEAQVAQIRARYTGAWGQQTALGNEYGVSQATISAIVRGAGWTHSDPSYSAKSAIRAGKEGLTKQGMPRGERHGRAKLTEDDVRAIRRRHAAGGISQQSLADEYGVKQTVVSQIIRRKRWAHVD